MPLYRYQCKTCEHTEDAYRSVENRNQGPECCGAVMEKQITSYMISSFTPYKTAAIDHDQGECITIKSRKEHEAFLRRNGYEEVGNDKSMAPPPREEFEEKQARERKELEQAAAEQERLNIDLTDPQLIVEDL